MNKITFLVCFLFITIFACQTDAEQKLSSSIPDKSSIYSIAVQHEQIFENSCIPMSVEMILKFNNAMAVDNYDLQESWQNKIDGTFNFFDGKIISGIIFNRHFNLPRDEYFPVDSLFSTIDKELADGRKVIISLPSGYMMWHMYVIDGKTDNDEYLAYSRIFNINEIITTDQVKHIVRNCMGTDIMTYTVL